MKCGVGGISAINLMQSQIRLKFSLLFQASYESGKDIGDYLHEMRTKLN